MTAQAARLDLPALIATPSHSSSRATFATALAIAGLMHLILLFAVSFVSPVDEAPSESGLEVLILKDAGQSTEKPLPDAALSRRSRAGESVHGDAATSLSGRNEAPPEAVADRARPDAVDLESEAAAAPTVGTFQPIRRTESVLSARTDSEMAPVLASEVLPEPDVRVDAAQILASRGVEIERLTARLEAKSEAYAKRVRRKSISASTRELSYASYLDAWARKVERIGNINYPSAAKEQRVYGSLILHVAVRSDGSVERIRVVRSSGYDLLDEAAIQIVELSAPFSPFSPDIAAETDVLDIIRTWQFMRGNVLGWEH